MNENVKNSYNEDSMLSFGVIGGIREKPSSIGIENQNHTFVEILANSIDESREGYGDHIIITKHEGGSISIQDYGRSLPMDLNSKGEYAYEKTLNELWSSGKYKNNEDTGSYKKSLGTNGCGLVASNYTSDFLEATAFNPNGFKYYIRYEKGFKQCELIKEPHNLNYTGTIIHWKPSAEVFRGKGEVDTEFIEEILYNQSIINKGLRFTFHNEKADKTKEYYYENGVFDYIKEISEDSNFTDVIQWNEDFKGSDDDNDKEYTIGAEITFCFNNQINHMRYFHNSSWLEHGGSPDTFIKNAFVSAIDKLIKQKNKYLKSEKKITFDNIKDSLIIISDTYSTISLFTDQVKKKMKSELMEKVVSEWLKEQLEIYFIENPLEADKIVEQVLINKRASEKAEQTKLNIKKKLQGNISSIDNRVNGFINCKSKDKSKNILTICEGKSSLSAMLSGRQNIHAIFPIRGKILNCLKASVDEILKNDVISNLIKVMGCGIEIGGKKKGENFNIENLNFHRIDIYVDSDLDGIGSILPLLLTVFWKLTPTLVKEGRINLVGTPKYEVLYGNDEFLYAINDRELENIKDKLNGQKYEIHYIKGLAELSSEAMAMCLHPDYKNITQITLEDIEESIRTLELYMGSNVTPRRLKILSSFEEDAV